MVGKPVLPRASLPTCHLVVEVLGHHVARATHALLAEAHVEPPQIMRLADALNMPAAVTTQAAFLAALSKQK